VKQVKNISIIFFFVLICLLLQTTVLRLFLSDLFVPNLLVIFVVYLSFYRVSPAGVIVSFILGLILDFSSGLVLGPWAASFVVVFCTLAVLSDRIFVESHLAALVMVFLATIASDLIYFFLSIESPLTYGQMIRSALATALTTAIFAWPVLGFLRRVFGKSRSRVSSF